MGRFFIFIYIFLEVGELYDGTNITKLSHHDGKFTEEINQLINQLINLFQIKCCDVNFYHQTTKNCFTNTGQKIL